MRSLAVSLGAAALTLALGAVLLVFLGVPPLDAGRGMAAFAWERAGDAAAKTTVLALLGVGVSVAFRAGFWNVGAEGQLCVGAVAAAGVALFVAPCAPGAAPWLWQAAALGAGAAAGALWCLGPALVKVRWQASEIVTTLMLVYVARKLLEHLYLGPWKDPQGFGFPGSAPLPDRLLVPLPWFEGLAVGAAVAATLLVFRTVLGHEMELLSQSRDVARYAGVRVGRCLAAASAVSGALAGLAGAAQVTGTAGRLISGISVGDGFTAVIVACLAGRHPLAVLVAAPFWAVLKVGAQDLELTYHVPQAFGTALEGLFLLCWLAAGWAVDRQSPPVGEPADG